MKRQLIGQGVMFVLLLVAGVACRAWMEHSPNFGPVAAIALFAGFFFQSRLLAAALPLAIMGISDQMIGGYDAPMMAVVHAALVMPVLGGFLLKRAFPVNRSSSTVHFLSGVAGTTLASSCLFFLITNFGSWLWFDMYEPTWNGLIQCYVSAVPFFRHTLEGDFLFATLIFGTYTAYARLVLSGTETAQAASERATV